MPCGCARRCLFASLNAKISSLIRAFALNGNSPHNPLPFPQRFSVHPILLPKPKTLPHKASTTSTVPNPFMPMEASQSKPFRLSSTVFFHTLLASHQALGREKALVRKGIFFASFRKLPNLPSFFMGCSATFSNPCLAKSSQDVFSPICFFSGVLPFCAFPRSKKTPSVAPRALRRCQTMGKEAYYDTPKNCLYGAFRSFLAAVTMRIQGFLVQSVRKKLLYSGFCHRQAYALESTELCAPGAQCRRHCRCWEDIAGQRHGCNAQQALKHSNTAAAC